MSNKSRIYTIIITALVTCFLTLTVENIITAQTTGNAMRKISLINEILSEYSLFDVDEDKIADYASMAMAASVEDPYTAYFNAEEFSAYTDNITSSYVGIGVTLGANIEKNEITIVSCSPNGPAAKAGLKSGDIVVGVDDKSIAASRLTEVSMHIKTGEIGSKVKITVERKDAGRLDFMVPREKVNKQSVDYELLENDIGYIRITSFDFKTEKKEKDTYDEFSECLDALVTGGAKKIILDLRGNPGGELTVACKIADKFLPKGTITYTEDKYGKRSYLYSDSEELNMPVAILVDDTSASASEVVTGALRDYKKATIIGIKTYGKGIVQSVFPLSDGSGITITTAKYYTPNGECIHEKGIEPDISVGLDVGEDHFTVEKSEDNQLQKAIEILKN